MTDADFLAWLLNPDAIRCVLVEAVVNVGGTDITRYLSTANYVTSASDTPANTAYLSVVNGGIGITESLAIDSGGSSNATNGSVATASQAMTTADIKIENSNGERDSWLNDVWANRSVQAFIGDPRWIRSDFRMIFNGIAANIDSAERGSLNIIMTDKSQRLNVPISSALLGGTTTNANNFIPLCFGECHNVTPLLIDPALLKYQVHNGPIESIIEVRDNGVPVPFTATLSAGTFVLTNQPVGTITCSVQGDKPSGTYYNKIADIVQQIVQRYGVTSLQFSSGDLDSVNLSAFNTACPQPVGVYCANGENLLTTIQGIAVSVGAQVVMSRLGLLQLIQVTLPASGTPTAIGPNNMLQNDMAISLRTDVIGAKMVGYCQNYTQQENLLTGIPPLNAILFGELWLSKTVTDSTTQTLYKLGGTPIQEDTCLLVGTDASAEATRRLNLYKVQRSVYNFHGQPELLMLILGQAVTLTNYRFNLSSGVAGMVVSLQPDWLTGRVQVGIFA